MAQLTIHALKRNGNAPITVRADVVPGGINFDDFVTLHLVGDGIDAQIFFDDATALADLALGIAFESSRLRRELNPS